MTMTEKLNPETWDEINKVVPDVVEGTPDPNVVDGTSYAWPTDSDGEKLDVDEVIENAKAMTMESTITKPTIKMLSIMEKEIEFFKSNNTDVYASVKKESGTTHLKVESTEFQDYVKYLCYNNKVMPTEALSKNLIQIIKVKTLHNDSPIEAIHFRLGWEKDQKTLWILRSVDPKVEYIKVTKDRWSKELECPIKIIVGSDSGSLPDPVADKDGDFSLLNDYLNVSDEHIPLTEAWLLEASLGSEFPILSIQGEAGTGKSTLIEILHCLIDPVLKNDGTIGGTLRPMYKDSWSMFASAKRTHLLAMDNLSKVKDFFNDVLCQIATGGSYEARTHQTMEDTTKLSTVNPVIIGSISQVSEAPDVLRRSVYIRTIYLGKDKSKLKSEFWDSFYKDLPIIYSGYLNLLVYVLQNRESIQPENIESMTDFWITGRVLELFMKDKWTITFDEAMEQMTLKASQDLEEQNPLIQLIIKYYNNQPDTELAMTTSEWNEKLFSKTDDSETDYLIKQLSRTEVRALGKQFATLQPLLRKLGYEFNKKRTSKSNQWILSNPNRHSTNSTNSTNRDETPPSESGMSGMSGNNPTDIFGNRTGNYRTHDDF